VLVAGYHNTYPAEDVTGLMVANYLMQDLMSHWMHASGGVDPELAETLVHPVQELPEILRIETAVRARFASQLPRFATLDENQSRRVLAGEGLDPSKEPRLFFLRQAFLADTFNAEVADAYFERVHPDLTLVHFQAIDLASHYYLYYHRPEAYRSLHMDPATVAALDADRGHFEHTVAAFHEELDAWLGKLSAHAGDDTGVIVVSDPGFGPVADAFRPGGHEDARPGSSSSPVRACALGPASKGLRCTTCSHAGGMSGAAALEGAAGEAARAGVRTWLLDAATRNVIATYDGRALRAARGAALGAGRRSRKTAQVPRLHQVSDPAISVVICTYNHGRYIPEAVESVLAQTFTDRELIVVDDGSTDGTGELLSRYGSRLRYVRQSNAGAFAARNTGRGLARGRWIAFLDADDVWEPHALTRLKQALDSGPRVGLAAGTYRSIDAEGNPIGRPYRRSRPGSKVSVESLLLTDADVPGCSTAAEALDAAGPFSEINRYCGDYELWLSLAMTWEIVVVDEPLLRKREHATNLTGEALRMLPAKIDAVDRFAAAFPSWAASHARLLKRAQAKNHERLAKWCLRQGDPAHRVTAREHLAQALALNPWRPKLYLLRARA
jgi:hypothetical protein